MFVLPHAVRTSTSIFRGAVNGGVRVVSWRKFGRPAIVMTEVNELDSLKMHRGNVEKFEKRSEHYCRSMAVAEQPLI